MIKSDNILEINDKLNSLRYCFDNDSNGVNKVEISKSIVIDKLSEISEYFIGSVSRMNDKLPILEKSKSDIVMVKRIENGLKNKMTIYMSAIYKSELIKRDLHSIDSEIIRVPQHVKKFIQNV